MKSQIFIVLLLSVAAVMGDLKLAKELMKLNQPVKAGEVLRQLHVMRPTDPWVAYNSAVASYAAKEYLAADIIWQGLAATPLPNKLRDQVWIQVGNVSFRLGEQVEISAPDQALTRWEQSREAYRVSLAAKPRDKVVANNLYVVEQRLAKLHARLAKRLAKESQEERENQKAIEKLEAALDHQRTANSLAPKDEEIATDRKKMERVLADKYTKKASVEEKRADESLDKKNLDPWAQKWQWDEAAKNLNDALTDFAQAKSLDAENKDAAEGDPRVQEKLAKLAAQQGAAHHKEGNRIAEQNPESAIDKLEQALDKFDESLNYKNDQPETQQEQASTKQDLEKLLEKQGDKLAQQGEQHVQHQPAHAAEEKMAALQHYQEAQALNPDNLGLQPKIDALEKSLPDLLNALGEREQQQAAQSESESTEKAVAHLERAASAYQLAQEITPSNQKAQQGAEQVKGKLAQLRALLASQNAPKAESPSQPKDQPGPGFEQMLAKVKSDDKQRQYEQSRRNQTQKYTPEQNRLFKTW